MAQGPRFISLPLVLTTTPLPHRSSSYNENVATTFYQFIIICWKPSLFFFNFVSLPSFSFLLLHPIFCLGRGRQEASAKADKGEPFETKCRVCIARIGKEGDL